MKTALILNISNRPIPSPYIRFNSIFFILSPGDIPNYFTLNASNQNYIQIMGEFKKWMEEDLIQQIYKKWYDRHCL